MVNPVNRMPTGTVGVGSAMPTSTVPSVRVKPTAPRPAPISPDALERQQKGATPKPTPPTRPITVPALDPTERQKAEDLDEATYNARSGRAGDTPTIGGGAAEAWRSPRMRAASMLGLEGLGKPKPGEPPLGVGERWRAGLEKGNSWRQSIVTMGMLEERWSRSIVGKGAAMVLGVPLSAIASGGKLNPLAPLMDPIAEYRAGRKGGALKMGLGNLAMQLGMLMFTGLAVDGQRDAIAAMMRENNIPEAYIDGAVQAYIDASIIPEYANSVAAGTVNDAQIIGASTALGAAIGAWGLGIGAIPGAGLGWVGGTIIAGANNFLAMFTGNQAPNLYSVIPYNAYEDENFAGRKIAEAEANKAVTNYLASQDPNRFVAYDEVQNWTGQYYGADAPIQGDPRNEEIYGLIKKGYFINKNPDGTYGVDIVAWQNYMIDTAAFRSESDKTEYLPKITPTGAEFAKNDDFLNTQDEWNGIWRNNSYLEYEP